MIVANSFTPTGRILATFTVTDTSLTATGATICGNYGDEKRKACRYQRFDGQSIDDDWDDDEDDDYIRWDIVGQPGSWTVSYPIGFDPISREECLTAAWNENPDFFASIDVMNDAGVVLGTGEFPYTVKCTGLEGGATGPDRTRVYAGKATKSQAFTFVALDSTKILKSYRVCQYSSSTGRYTKCDRERLLAKNRYKDGWAVTYNLTYPALGSSRCAYVGRKWPQEGLRIEYYDGSLKKRLTLFRGTRLDC